MRLLLRAGFGHGRRAECSAPPVESDSASASMIRDAWCGRGGARSHRAPVPRRTRGRAPSGPCSTAARRVLSPAEAARRQGRVTGASRNRPDRSLPARLPRGAGSAEPGGCARGRAPGATRGPPTRWRRSSGAARRRGRGRRRRARRWTGPCRGSGCGPNATSAGRARGRAAREARGSGSRRHRRVRADMRRVSRPHHAAPGFRTARRTRRLRPPGPRTSPRASHRPWRARGTPCGATRPERSARAA